MPAAVCSKRGKSMREKFKASPPSPDPRMLQGSVPDSPASRKCISPEIDEEQEIARASVSLPGLILGLAISRD